jgi:hypothetical protein
MNVVTLGGPNVLEAAVDLGAVENRAVGLGPTRSELLDWLAR